MLASAVVLGVVVLAVPAWAQTENQGVIIVGLPADQARVVTARTDAALGLGVYPSSREAEAFFSVLARGDRVEAGGIIEAAEESGLTVEAAVAARAGDDPVEPPEVIDRLL